MEWSRYPELEEVFGDYFQSGRDGGRIWSEKGDNPKWRHQQRLIAVTYETAVAQMGAFNIPKRT